MKDGTALKTIDERLQDINRVESNLPETSFLIGAFEGLNYIDYCYSKDENVRVALINIKTYIESLEQQLMKYRREYG
jgi:hypothetical protein